MPGNYGASILWRAKGIGPAPRLTLDRAARDKVKACNLPPASHIPTIYVQQGKGMQSLPSPLAHALGPFAITLTIAHATLFGSAAQARASDLALSGFDMAALVADTILLDVAVGSARTARIEAASSTRYELSDGTPVNAASWYGLTRRDLSIRFLTAMNDKVGLIWGLSTGDRGDKYKIAPSLTVGVVGRHAFSRNTWVTLSATVDIGGRTTEAPCVADFGALGGVQSVNCRLAASEIPPEQTLQYLFRDSLGGLPRLTLAFTHRF
jgi:hypothetical protein